VLGRFFVLAVFTLAAEQGATTQNVRTLRLTTPDNVGISAAYYSVTNDPAPAVLLVHGFTTNRDDWGTFPMLLQLNGIAALTFDLRGHGESNRKMTAQGPVVVDYHTFTAQDCQDMLLDINTANDWLMEQPGIDRKRVGIVGASLGANLAVRYAMFNDELAALVLISPGLRYNEVRTDTAIQKIGAKPMRIVVSRDDAFAFESCQRLIEIRKEIGYASDTNALLVCTGSLHGAPMLRGVKDLPALLVNWLKQTLQTLEPSPAAEPPAKAPEPSPPVEPSTNAPATAK
jgi:pimeloyl-ACP methyl ester carboxylesterase